MVFQDMMKDKIVLIKKSGERHLDLQASVQGSKVYYMNSKPLFEPGDEIVRVASNGLEERMTVIDPGFREGHGGIPAHYQMTVQKANEYRPPVESLRQQSNAPQQHQSTIVYNLNGDNARINHGSVDNSVNVVNRQEESAKLISELRELFAKASIPSVDLALANDTLDVVEGQFESNKPKVSIVTRMLESLPKVADAGEAVAKLLAMAQAATTN